MTDDQHQAQLQKASSRVLDALQEALGAAEIGDESGQGMVLSFLCIVEVLDSEGQSRVAPLWNDPRTTVLLGLSQTGSLMVQSGAFSTPPGF